MVKRLALTLSLALLMVAGDSIAQQKVDTRGITSTLKFEEALSGHVPELNGKFKVRVSEVIIEAGGFLGPHHHAGPGARFVVSGAVSFAQAGATTLYKAGDAFYESGNVAHTAHNKTKGPVRVIFFEILPVEWSGPSLIPPKPN